jgi:GT2 family glycosyltransferase
LAGFRLSVVIPTHETRDLVVRCLQSLDEDDRLEVIVVDDASTDQTSECITRGFGRVRLIRHESAQGFTASVNEGLAIARGDLLLLLNSDTEVRPRAFDAVLAAFQADARLGIAGAALENPDGSPQWSSGREPSLVWLFGLSTGFPRWLRENLPQVLRRDPGQSMAGPVCWVTGAAMVIRRHVYLSLGPLETAYRFYVQDMDYCLRARDAGFGVEVVPGFRVMHLGGATVSRSEGAVGSAHPELLLLDLLTWGALRRGSSWANRARWALLGGLRLRVAFRYLVATVLPRSHGSSYQKATQSLADAARALAAARPQRREGDPS